MLFKSSIIIWIGMNAFQSVFGCDGQEIQKDLPEINGDHFYYFGYGSNMLAARLHRQNPKSKRIGMGRLKDYRLDFYGFGELWQGAPATIIPLNDSEVFGSVWNIHLINLPNIDRQELVHEGLYMARSVPINLSNGTELTARVYLMVNQPMTKLQLNATSVPFDRQPSKTYLQCLVQGAIETGLPTDYVTWLKAIKHNGKVSETMENALNLRHIELNWNES